MQYLEITVGNILLFNSRTESCCECGIACIAVTLCAFGQHMFPGGELDAPPVRGGGGEGRGEWGSGKCHSTPEWLHKEKVSQDFPALALTATFAC